MTFRLVNHIWLVAIIILPLSLFADYSFEYDPGIRAGILPEDGIEVYLGGGHLVNTGTSDDVYHVTLDVTDLPYGWSANFCAGSMCYPTEADIDVMAGRDTEMSVHVYPDSIGSAMLTLTINSVHAGRADTVHYWASMDPEILIINDSGEPDISQWYSNTLSNIGKYWGVLNRHEIDIDSLDFGQFSSIIWFTGPDYDSVFNEPDTASIGGFLADGGKFILSSQGAGSYCEDAGMATWLNSRLKVDWVEDDSALTAFYGLSGTVFDGINGALGCVGGPESFDRPSVLSATGGSLPLIGYEAVGDPTAALGYYEETGGKIVYFGFPWEAISSDSVRDSVLAKALAYVDGAGYIDENGMLPQSLNIRAYPNPFNSAVKIELRGIDQIENEIHICDMMGKSIKHLKLDHNGSAIWDATNSTGHEVPAGVYFIQIDSPDFKAERVLYLK